FKNIKVAYSADFGAALPIEDVVRNIFNEQLKIFNDLGCYLEEASIDFTDAAETFQILRANEFALNYGELYFSHKKEIKETVNWNIKKGIELTSNQLKRAEISRSSLYNKTNDFF